MRKLFILILVTVTLFSCKKDENEPVNTNNFVTKIIAHRGSGGDDFPGKDSTFARENTFDAIKIGFLYVNGCETDIQMSLDGTVWLWHDSSFPDYNGQVSIPTMHDSEIIALQLSDKHVAKLDTVLYWMSEYAPNRYISLDVKGYFPLCPNLDLYSYYDRMSDSVVAMLKRYQIERNVFVETDYRVFLDYMKAKDSIVDTYFLAYSNLRYAIDIAVNCSYTGVSFAYNDTSMTQRNMDYLRSKGKKIQVWTLTTVEGIEQMKAMKVDVIQSDLIKNVLF